MKYLIETALLTHGLRSLTNNYLLENWTLPEALIAWIYKGEIKIGTITKYLSFRTEAQSAIRIDCSILENALKNGVSGAHCLRNHGGMQKARYPGCGYLRHGRYRRDQG